MRKWSRNQIPASSFILHPSKSASSSQRQICCLFLVLSDRTPPAYTDLELKHLLYGYRTRLRVSSNLRPLGRSLDMELVLFSSCKGANALRVIRPGVRSVTGSECRDQIDNGDTDWMGCFHANAAVAPAGRPLIWSPCLVSQSSAFVLILVISISKSYKSEKKLALALYLATLDIGNIDDQDRQSQHNQNHQSARIES
jgi:hypothetical protein